MVVLYQNHRSWTASQRAEKRISTKNVHLTNLGAFTMETIQKYLKIIVESNYLHQRKLDLLKEQKRIITNNVYSFFV